MKILKKPAIFFFNIIDFYHQKKILSFFRKKKINIDTFVDVGSHKGKYFDLFDKNYKIKKTLLIEPQKQYFHYLKKKYKGFNSVKIFDCAISNKNGTTLFYINHHDLTSSLNTLNHKNVFLKIKSRLFGVELKNMIKKKVKVKINTLNNILKRFKIKQFDLVKIDTEGHELQVLQGIGKTMKKIKIFLIEFRNDNVYKNYNPTKIHNNLIKNNFYLSKVFKFPFTTWEDRIYIQK